MRGSQLQIERGEQLELPLLALSLYPVCWYSLSSSSSIIARGNVTPGRGGGPLNWSAGEWAGVTRADPVDIVSTRQVMSCRQDLGGLQAPETKKARTASIRSDPCPAGAFARLHHTQIKISSPDHQPTNAPPVSHYYCHFHSFLITACIAISSRSVILWWRRWCLEAECSKCHRSKRAGGLPLGKASGKARPAPSWSFFHRSVISFRKYSGRPHNRERGDQLGLNIQWTILASKQQRGCRCSAKYTALNFSSSTSLSLWVAGLRSGNFAVSGSAQDPFLGPAAYPAVPGGGPGSDVTHIPGYSWPRRSLSGSLWDR